MDVTTSLGERVANWVRTIGKEEAMVKLLRRKLPPSTCKEIVEGRYLIKHAPRGLMVLAIESAMAEPVESAS